MLGVDIDVDRLRATKCAIGDGPTVLEADLADPEACRAVVEAASPSSAGSTSWGTWRASSVRITPWM